MRTLGESFLKRFYLFTSGIISGLIIRWNEEERWVQYFLFYPRGLIGSLQTYRERGGIIYSACSVCQWLSQWWLVFVLLGVDATLSVEFENICTVSGKWNISWVIWKRFTLMHNCGFPINTIPDEILWVANFRFPFY